MRAEAKIIASEDVVSDVDLALAIAGGDQGAFQALIRRHGRLLYRTARSIVRDDADAEDCVQNALLRAFRKIAGYRGDAKLSTWLVRIVVNEALACLRRRARSPRFISLSADELDAASETTADTLTRNKDSPEEALMRADTWRLIDSSIDELPPAYRSVFMLRAWEELSVAAAAAALGVPGATVRTRFFRARAQLRQRLLTKRGALAPHLIR